MMMPWTVYLLPQAETELESLPAAERVAVLNAAKKLEALGPDLSYPHTSAVRDADALRELRPRGGRSALARFLSRVGDVFVVARWVRRPRLTRGASNGRSRQQRHG